MTIPLFEILIIVVMFASIYMALNSIPKYVQLHTTNVREVRTFMRECEGHVRIHQIDKEFTLTCESK